MGPHVCVCLLTRCMSLEIQNFSLLLVFERHDVHGVKIEKSHYIMDMQSADLCLRRGHYQLTWSSTQGIYCSEHFPNLINKQTRALKCCSLLSRTLCVCVPSVCTIKQCRLWSSRSGSKQNCLEICQNIDEPRWSSTRIHYDAYQL